MRRHFITAGLAALPGATVPTTVQTGAGRYALVEAALAVFRVRHGFAGATVAITCPHLPGRAVGHADPDNACGLPKRRADAGGRLGRKLGVERAGGRLTSTAGDLVRRGNALFAEAAMPGSYAGGLLGRWPAAREAPEIRHCAGVAINPKVACGLVHGHGGWSPAHVSGMRHHADRGVTVVFRAVGDAGVLQNGPVVVPKRGAAPTDPATGTIR